MTDATTTNPRDLLQQAQQLPHGPEKVALLSEAARQADVLRDTDLAYRIRDDLIDAASHAGDAPTMITAFAWCLQHADRDEEGFRAYSLLWRYKWVLGGAMSLPAIPLARIEALVRDYEERLERGGHSKRPAARYRLLLALHVENDEAVRDAYAAWRALKPGWLDCQACERQTLVQYHLHTGAPGRALQAARPLLEGRFGCNRVPGVTLGALLLPLLQLGRAEEADAHHARGYALVRGTDDMLSTHADHLTYLALRGRTDDARRVYRRHLPYALRTREPDEALDYHTAAAVLFRMLEGTGKTRVRAALPEHAAPRRADGSYAAHDLRAYHEAEAYRIARLFDTRNGTDAHARHVTRKLALVSA